jgi:hypothetical protein
VTLVFIYGAPAVGKLTTAREVAGLTGFRLFHNHVAFDFAKSLFNFPSPPFRHLMETVRLAAFEAAVRERLCGLVFTFVYAPPHDDPFVERTIEVIEGGDGNVVFARLVCDAAINEARVNGEDRRALGKITTVAGLRAARTRWDLSATIPFRPGIEIDNTNVDAHTVARRIISHYRLPLTRP